MHGQKEIVTAKAAKANAGIGSFAHMLAWLVFLAGLLFTFAHVALADGKLLADPSKPDPAIEGQPNEASGYDLYQRGFYPEAIAEWKKAVEEKNDPGAAFRLGEEYFDAKVVERDVAEAIKYHSIGAYGGDPRSQMDLASMYDKGWGLPQDVKQAAKWYEAAARGGLESAQYNIGTMYEDGVGVERDLVKAYMYYQLAIKNGFPRFATEAIERISETMESAQIKEASLLVRSFKPLTREESAAELQKTEAAAE